MTTMKDAYRGFITPKLGGEKYWNDAAREELRDAYQRATLSHQDYTLAKELHALNIEHTLDQKRVESDKEQFKAKFNELSRLKLRDATDGKSDMECNLTELFMNLALKREQTREFASQRSKGEVGSRKFMSEYLREDDGTLGLYCYAAATSTWAATQQKLLEKATMRLPEDLKKRCSAEIERRFGDSVKLINTSPLGMPTYAMRVKSTNGKKWSSSGHAALELWWRRLNSNDDFIDNEVRRLRR
jgi:hypothetical protein